MILGSCLKLVFRRLALRKGVAVTAACLFLLGLGLLYYQFSKSDDYSASNIGIRKIVVPTLSSSLPQSKPHNLSAHPLPINLDQSNKQAVNRPIRLKPSAKSPIDGTENELHVISNQVSECLFSSAQPSSEHVDIKMAEIVDQLSFDDRKATGGWNQGFDISYTMDDFKEQQLQVIVMPHSHNDPGWIKTFEEYYRKQTRNILNLMTDALTADRRKTFIWAEISYLDLWWQEQVPDRRQKFKRLVENGQLEIVTGGWVMNDEANTHYFAMLDQLMEGHLWLQKNLPGVAPATGWAIDPFGYTSTMAYLLQGTGLDSMLIQRVHYALKKHLALNKQLEFGWLQQWDQTYDTGILCHTMPFYSYDVPHTCGPNPKICCQFDFVRLPGGRIKCPWKVTPVAITDGNIKERSEMLADQYRKKSRLYRTNVLLVPLGDDFRWDTQREIDAQFTNYYKLMDYMNAHADMNINVQFGTLSDYFEALRGSVAPNVKNGIIPDGFPMLTGDFFTYADRADHYWSGYYTSRPYHKNMDRVLQTNLRAAEVFYSLAIARGLPLTATRRDVATLLTDARRNLGLFQHHDGITGTAKDHVVIDYAKRVVSSVTATKGILSDSVKALAAATVSSHLTEHVRTMTFKPHESFGLRKIAQHEKVQVFDGSKVVTVVNPLTQVAKQLVTINVDSPAVTVMDSSNTSLPCQISPIFGPSNEYIADRQFILSFIADVPALGFSHYVIGMGAGSCMTANIQFMNMESLKSQFFNTEQVTSHDDFLLSNNYNLEAKFSGTTGLLKSLSNGPSKVEIDMDFVTYGTTSGRDKSGAYLFFPGGDAKSVTSGWAKPPVTVVVGPLFQEVRTTIDSGLVVHSVQLINSPGIDGKSVAISNLVDITKESNKELAMRVHSSIENADGTFYTDENGFQMIKRKTYSKIPLQGNFYPMPTSALIQDDNTRVTLLSGQPLGAAALKKGWLEVILDRRLMQDDNRGVGQGVKDNVVTLEPFRLLVERRLGDASPTASLVYPSLVAHASLDNLLHPIQILVSSPPPTPDTLTPYTPLTDPFPCDLHLVNLRALVDFGPELEGSALILHRRGFECGFDYSPLNCDLVDGEIKLSDMFAHGNLISTATHTSLSLLHEKAVLDPETGFKTQIPPMQIHTYKLTW